MSKTNAQQLGATGEAMAKRYLLGKEMVCLHTNYRQASGEIDLICRDGEEIVFVEVKTRRSVRFGMPEMAVDQGKLKKIIETGLSYLEEQQLENCAWRVDVVSILFSQEASPEITHYKGIRLHD